MIIWSRLGFLVAVFVFGAAIACNLAFDHLYGNGYYSTHKWTIGVAMLIAAAPSWFVGRALRGKSDQVVIDKETGKEFVLDRNSHSLFFVPMHFWGPILVVIGVGLCVWEFVK
jgi:hypothetical protein